MSTVTNGSYQMHSVDAVIDVFIFTEVIHTVHQRLTHYDIPEGNNVGNDRRWNRVEEYFGIGKSNRKRQVVPQLVKSRLGNAPLNIRHVVFASGEPNENGHYHARNHAVVGDFAGKGVALNKALERHREHQIQTNQTANNERYRRIGHSAAHFNLSHQCRNTRTDNNAAFHGAGNQIHQFASQAGNAEEKENDKHKELQSKHSLNGVGARLIITQEKQHHRDARRYPAWYQRNAQQGRQHKPDAADHGISQGNIVGNTQVFLQQRNH